MYQLIVESRNVCWPWNVVLKSSKKKTESKSGVGSNVECILYIAGAPPGQDY